MISKHEYADRIRKARELMEDKRFDILLIYSDAWRIGNVGYFTGFRSYDGIVPIYISFLSLPLEEEPTLFVYHTLLPTAHTESQLNNIASLDELPAYLKNFRAKHNPKKIGIVGETIFPTSIYRVAQNVFDGITIEPCDIVARLKAVKTEAEITMMKKAGELTDEGLKAAIGAIREGASEYEIVAAANYAMSSKGPGGPCIDCMTQSGTHSEVLLKRPTERKIQRGDMILIDLAARYNMYASDVGRGVVFAGTKEQEKILEVAVSAFEKGFKIVKSGVKACEIYAAIQEVIDEAGYGQYFKESAGHGIGMDPEEEIPFITSENEMIIQPNMAFCLKSAIMVPEKGGLRVEDVVVARETGGELLTTYERRLKLD